MSDNAAHAIMIAVVFVCLTAAWCTSVIVDNDRELVIRLVLDLGPLKKR